MPVSSDRHFLSRGAAAIFIVPVIFCLTTSLTQVRGYRIGSPQERLPNDWKDIKFNQVNNDGAPPKRSLGGSLPQQDRFRSNDGRFLSIGEAPPKSVEAREHGKLVLECSASGTPAPQVTWYKAGRPLFKGIENRGNLVQHFGYGAGRRFSGDFIEESLGETRSKVSLDCLGEKDAGTYECVATNGKSEVVATEVNVVSFGSNGCKVRHPADVRLTEPPIIYQWMKTYMQTIGLSARLVCRATGNQKTSWYGPNQSLIDTNSGEKFQMTTEGDLIVSDLAFADMGVFRCLVENSNGSDSAETFLYPLAANV